MSEDRRAELQNIGQDEKSSEVLPRRAALVDRMAKQIIMEIVGLVEPDTRARELTNDELLQVADAAARESRPPRLPPPVWCRNDIRRYAFDLAVVVVLAIVFATIFG